MFEPDGRVTQEHLNMRASELLDFVGTYKPAYRKPLAPEFLDAASELCDLYVSASAKERDEIRSNLSLPGANVMGGFANVMAVEAVRQNSPDLVRKALIALSIENCRPDYRDSTACLSRVFHSAVKLGMDVPHVFSEMAAISGPAGTKLFLNWLARDPALQSLAKFFIAEGTDSDGKFIYVSTKP
jgi:hypothetical protein